MKQRSEVCKCAARVIESTVQLVDRLRPKRVANLGAVERDPSNLPRRMQVIGDVREVLRPRCDDPLGGVKNF